MRKNLPVTANERFFPKEQKLISSTDLKGIIRHCNDSFVEISGFSRDELIGSPHNIVRHPDMPELAFHTMWSYLKAGKPWMGLVKNRCKNGDYYWVDAYVTPITENGQVIGYESVRTVPLRSDVARADKLYGSLRTAGKSKAKRSNTSVASVLTLAAPAIALILSWLAYLYVGGIWGMLLLTALFAVIGGALIVQKRRLCDNFKQLMPDSFTDPLAVASYTDADKDVGSTEVAIRSMWSHLNTVISRIEDAATLVALKAGASRQLSSEAVEALGRQQAKTELVATAVNEMSSTIAEVAVHVQDTATQAEDADKLTATGHSSAQQTRTAIQHLQQSVEDISRSVQELAVQTGNIANVAQIIEQIADQTNLLALNAAIEAARAGDQGRGFAVVADEVRQLAHRTSHSTKEIHVIISSLTTKAGLAVKAAEEGCHDASSTVEQVFKTEQVLSGISDAVNRISDMARHMATAVEQQAHVAEDINRQVVAISDLAVHSLGKGKAAAEEGDALQGTASDLKELVVRFRKG
ncbi:PAS domain-containing methyl-accepting chemotaxis protein [Chromatiaceae bacterium AAb-1]|nr:PAS domain-containing methyl-accepting chemotaxis protein [Chromatiaceae bacterium AAb-1]